MLLGKLATDFKGLLVQGDRLRLALELLVQGPFHLRRIDFHQLANNPDIDHVGQKLAQPCIGRDTDGKFCKRNREKVKVFAELIEIQALFVDDHAARFHRHHVITCGVGIHGYQEIDFFAAGDPPVFVGADGKPGRKSGDIGRKEVLAADGYPHLKDGAHEDAVGRLTTGAVDGCNLDTEIVEYQFPRIASLVLLRNGLGRLVWHVKILLNLY